MSASGPSGPLVYCCADCLCGFCVTSLFCYAVLCVLSSFAIISLAKRKLVALPFSCLLDVLLLLPLFASSSRGCG